MPPMTVCDCPISCNSNETSNTKLQTGKSTPGGTCTPGWELLLYTNVDEAFQTFNLGGPRL